ncbi:MAG: PilZ domain-containing protein [Deltaproteobacteria bacterium]|nr:PilZ domain-containing protein [Deltaproteobacteria bacterium]
MARPARSTAADEFRSRDDPDAASEWTIFEPARGPVPVFPPRPRTTARGLAPVPPPGSMHVVRAEGGRLYRRAEVRRPVHVGVELVRGGQREAEFAVGADLTPDGLFLLADSRLPLGDLVRVSFVLPWSSEQYTFLGRVVRIQRARPDETGALFGFGLEFLGGTEAERSSLREALRGIPPALPYAPLAS